VVDTVALARYLENSLPKKANEILDKAETGTATILLPDIVIAEFIYTGLRGRPKISDPKATISELLDDLESSDFLRPIRVSSETWRTFIHANVLELHDRFIYSTAVSNGASEIITNDPEIMASSYPTMW
jgi:predicted nucleic acid-binding protein